MGIFDGEVQEAVAETVIETIALLGAGILVLAAALAFVNLGLLLANASLQREQFRQFVPFDRQVGGGTATVTRTRLQVAQLIALGLEVLVCGDLLETLVKSTQEYTFDSLYKLALVATIRTFLSFFLGLETEEILERAKVDRRLDGIAVGPGGGRVVPGAAASVAPADEPDAASDSAPDAPVRRRDDDWC